MYYRWKINNNERTIEHRSLFFIYAVRMIEGWCTRNLPKHFYYFNKIHIAFLGKRRKFFKFLNHFTSLILFWFQGIQFCLLSTSNILCIISPIFHSAKSRYDLQKINFQTNWNFISSIFPFNNLYVQLIYDIPYNLYISLPCFFLQKKNLYIECQVIHEYHRLYASV